jgi:hypothetical protein
MFSFSLTISGFGTGLTTTLSPIPSIPSSSPSTFTNTYDCYICRGIAAAPDQDLDERDRSDIDRLGERSRYQLCSNHQFTKTHGHHNADLDQSTSFTLAGERRQTDIIDSTRSSAKNHNKQTLQNPVTIDDSTAVHSPSSSNRTTSSCDGDQKHCQSDTTEKSPIRPEKDQALVIKPQLKWDGYDLFFDATRLVRPGLPGHLIAGPGWFIRMPEAAEGHREALVELIGCAHWKPSISADVSWETFT